MGNEHLSGMPARVPTSPNMAPAEGCPLVAKMPELLRFILELCSSFTEGLGQVPYLL